MTAALLPRDEEPLARHLPLRCGGAAEHWLEVRSEEQLVAAVKLARSEKWIIRPVQAFQDALPPEGGLVGLVVRLGGELEAVTPREDGTLLVGAGAVLAPIGLLPGFEALLDAPGTLWDAYEEGWIQPAITQVRRFRGRSIEQVDEAASDGRSLLVSAVLRPGAKVAPPRAGQVFREVTARGAKLRDLLRKAQLAGLRVHGATLGERDPAVLANRGDATPRELRALILAVKERVHSATGIQLEERLGPPGRGGRL